MKLFPKKKTRLQKRKFGEKTEDVTSLLYKTVAPANYTAVSYGFDSRWISFYNNLEKILNAKLDALSVDELNTDLFDTTIESAALEAINRIHRQHAEHLSFIQSSQATTEKDLLLCREKAAELEDYLNQINGLIDRYQQHLNDISLF